jgi:hypothetical protein
MARSDEKRWREEQGRSWDRPIALVQTWIRKIRMNLRDSIRFASNVLIQKLSFSNLRAHSTKVPHLPSCSRRTRQRQSRPKGKKEQASFSQIDFNCCRAQGDCKSVSATPISHHRHEESLRGEMKVGTDSTDSTRIFRWTSQERIRNWSDAWEEAKGD